jgi:integrase
MKYFYWRRNTLWCRYPLPGKKWNWSTGIKTTGTPADRKRCERDGEMQLSALRTKALTGTLIDKPAIEKAPYNPKFWRLVGRYWFFHLRFKKSGPNERYHLLAVLKQFGKQFARDIDRGMIEKWRAEQKKTAKVNTINNRFTYFKRIYAYANTESRAEIRLGYDPSVGLKKLEGGAVRQFVLTADRFERNHSFFKSRYPDFAFFYLALWETGRRPWEVMRYQWQMLDVEQRLIYVPESLNKKERCQTLPLSPRLFGEMMTIPIQERQGYIFKNRRGNIWRNYEWHFQQLKKAYGWTAGVLRDTRRGFITHKCEIQGRDPAHVQDFAGHATDEAFKRYRIGTLANLRLVVDDSTPGVQFAKIG